MSAKQKKSRRADLTHISGLLQSLISNLRDDEANLRTHIEFAEQLLQEFSED